MNTIIPGICRSDDGSKCDHLCPTHGSINVLDVSPVHDLGYTVEVRQESSNIPYKLLGEGGKQFFLCRNTLKPWMLFAVRESNSIKSVSIKGYSWFTDKNGTLKPV